VVSGKLIVIEGTDGSGKATQSQRLLRRLEEHGILTAYVDFPQYGQKSAGMVEHYLNGKYGTAEEVNPKAASIFYAIDRYDASFGIRKSIGEGKVVISNRYVSASMGHQGGKIHDVTQRNEYLEWLESLEYEVFGIPRPDLTILLYVPYQISQQLVGNKGSREYIGGIKKDIHEANKEHMINAESAFLEIAKNKEWTIIDCTRNGKILTIEEIHNMIWNEVQKLFEQETLNKQK
jgi:dTMP kinase